jgi:hypothetical protein
MSSYLKIHHTPNEEGMAPFTVIIDEGGPVEQRETHTDSLRVIEAVAAYLADCEGCGSVRCDCGYFGPREDCPRGTCPNCGDRVMRVKSNEEGKEHGKE